MPWKLMPPEVPSGLTPGVSSVNCSQRRELTGRFPTMFSLMFCAGWVLSVSSNGTSVVTVTSDSCAATGISKSILRVWPTCRLTPLRCTVANPGWLAVMS